MRYTMLNPELLSEAAKRAAGGDAPCFDFISI